MFAMLGFFDAIRWESDNDMLVLHYTSQLERREDLAQ